MAIIIILKTIASIGEDAEKLEPTYSAGGNIK